MRGREAALALLCAGCVLDATGGLEPSNGGAPATSSSTAETATTAETVSGSGGNTTCGDGVLEAFEPCDDGGQVDGDGCSAMCKVEAGYTCRGMPSVCTVCGDGVVSGWETCEDGNLRTDDGCSGCLVIATCGNRIVEPGEACDLAGVATPCTDTCTAGPTSECATAIDLGAIAEAGLLRARYDGDTRGATDLVFPENLIGFPDASGFGNCAEQNKPRMVEVVKHRWTTGPYPAFLDVQVTNEAADGIVNPFLWTYRGCDSPTSGPACNDNTTALLPQIRTALLPPLSQAVVAVSGFGVNDVGTYALKIREVQVPWQEPFSALPLAGELFQPLGNVTFCKGNCPTFDACAAPGCPDLDYMMLEDVAGPGPTLTLTSARVARRGLPRVDLEVIHEVFLGDGGAVSFSISEDDVVYVPVTSRTGYVKNRELVDLAPFLSSPDASFRIRLMVNGSTTAAGHYYLGLLRIRLFSDLP